MTRRPGRAFAVFSERTTTSNRFCPSYTSPNGVSDQGTLDGTPSGTTPTGPGMAVGSEKLWKVFCPVIGGKGGSSRTTTGSASSAWRAESA